MAEISRIKLPSGNYYDLKDATARQMIAGGISYVISWNGRQTPVVANIPEGVTITYLQTTYTGTLVASNDTKGKFYLVYSGTSTSNDVYDEYLTVDSPHSLTPGTTLTWEKVGDTQVNLSDLGDLAFLDNVTLSKGSGDNVLGEATTFTTTVTPTTTNIKATASGAAVGADGTDTFVKSYPGATSKLVTTSVPNVTSAGSASTWGFAMGSGSDSETLIISGANGAAPTLGTAITCATGSLDASGGGSSVMTGLGTATTASALTGVKVTSQPAVALSTGATAGTGVISVATGITSASTSAGTNDNVSVAKYGDLSVSVS